MGLVAGIISLFGKGERILVKKSETGSHAAVQNGNHTSALPQNMVSAGGKANTSGTSSFVPVGATPSSGEKKGKGNKKVALIVTLVIAAVLAVVYLGGAFYFSNHFFPNTQFSSHDVSFESNTDFAAEIDTRVQDYELSIEGSGFVYRLDADAANLSIDKNQVANDACLNQNIWLWPYEIFQTHDVSDVIEASYDQLSANNLITQAVQTFNATATPSKDAAIVYDEKNGICVLQKEQYGTQINIDVLLAKADACLTSLEPTCEVTSEELIKPTILASDGRFFAALDKANKMVGGEIALTLNGSVPAGSITKPMIASWLTLDAELNPVLNTELVNAWVQQKATEFNTVKSERTYLRADGKTCTVSGGTYGWSVNTDSLASTIIDAINAYNFAAIDIPCDQSAAAYNGAGKRDWAAYVDVDLSEQTVRYYDANDQLLYSCACVSGAPYDNRSTPTGVYYLNYKQSPSTLIGYKSNGEIDYETKVSYWMPFVGNSVGLHDASWQSSFGGTRYKDGYGSHGCVNLSVSDAKWFYDNLSKGVCIISHN